MSESLKEEEGKEEEVKGRRKIRHICVAAVAAGHHGHDVM